MGAVRIYRLPIAFWEDHANRELPAGAEVARPKYHPPGHYVECDDATIREILSDARFYADRWGPDLISAGLKMSARATVSAIYRQRPDLVPVKR